MVFVRRLGGWRPVDTGQGVGTLRLPDGRTIPDVGYTFEVWHQVAEGFDGPYRTEGHVSGIAKEELAPLVGRDVLLQLEDDRFLPGRIGPDAALLAHTLPGDVDPWERDHVG